MKYLNFLLAMDALYRYYPRCYTNEVVLLADDVWKWINNELPEDSSAVIYLKSCFESPAEALRIVYKEIQLISAPYLLPN